MKRTPRITHPQQCICVACQARANRRHRKGAPKHMPEVPACAPGDNVTLATLEHYHIKLVLEKASKLSEAAQILGIDLATLYRKRQRASQSC